MTDESKVEPGGARPPSRAGGALEGVAKVLALLYILQGVLFGVAAIAGAAVALREPNPTMPFWLLVVTVVATVVYIAFGVGLWREQAWTEGPIGFIVAGSNILIWLSPLVGFWEEFQIYWALQGGATIWVLHARRRRSPR